MKVKLIVWLLFFISVITFSSEDILSKKEKKILSENLNQVSVYENDKNHIAYCFKSIVEYFQVNMKDIDPCNYFEPYSNYLNNRPNQEGIKVEVDTIIYSNNKKLCFAFIIVGIVNHSYYDALGIIGLRDSVSHNFVIYPLDQYKAARYTDSAKALSLIKYSYTKRIKSNKGTSGTQYENVKFRVGVEDKDFFAKSPYFSINKNGLYNFQLYRDIDGTLKEYQYPPCKQPSR